MIELILNLIIFSDFIFRSRMNGGIRNWTCTTYFDFVVVLGCTLSFVLILFSSSIMNEIFEEISEEILFAIWSVWQYLRLLMFFKN